MRKPGPPPPPCNLVKFTYCFYPGIKRTPSPSFLVKASFICSLRGGLLGPSAYNSASLGCVARKGGVKTGTPCAPPFSERVFPFSQIYTETGSLPCHFYTQKLQYNGRLSWDCSTQSRLMAGSRGPAKGRWGAVSPFSPENMSAATLQDARILASPVTVPGWPGLTRMRQKGETWYKVAL